MLKSLLHLAAVLICLATPSHAQEPVMIGNVPLPENVTPTPATDAPFSGVWVGQWDNLRNHILVIENVDDAGNAQVIYAVGSDLHTAGRWFRRTGKVTGNSLVFTDDSFAARYDLSPSGRLRGIYADNRGFAILKRQDLDAMRAVPQDNWFSVGEISKLQTALIENNQPISLTTLTYRPQGKGPFPLALIHHGSTGSGQQPSDFDYIWANDWLADVLNAQGWLVAFPQRRGRGLSDGLYDEGFATDRTKGYSPDPALSLPGADRALQDANAALAALRKHSDVAPGPILLGGQSRGGVVAILQAGDMPNDVAGVINFVGGWVSEGWGDPSINPTLFARIGAFKGTVLSIYGEGDPYYSIPYSQSNLETLTAQGADSRLHIVKLSGLGNGHWAIAVPPLWQDVVQSYLSALR